MGHFSAHRRMTSSAITSRTCGFVLCIYTIRSSANLRLTLVLNELVEEAGFPRPSAANHQELEQEVWKQRRGGRDQRRGDIKGEPTSLPSSETILRFPLNPTELLLSQYPPNPN